MTPSTRRPPSAAGDHHHQREAPPPAQADESTLPRASGSLDAVNGTVKNEEDEDVYRRCKRQEIADTLAKLHDRESDLAAADAASRAAQRQYTRSLIKIMHLDTTDQSRIVAHTSHNRQQNEIQETLDAIRTVENRYQEEKKRLALIPDKKVRHEQVEVAKRSREEMLARLRARLKELDPDLPPSSTLRAPTADSSITQLPVIASSSNPDGVFVDRKPSSTTYRIVRDRIRELKKARRDMQDPYMANLKMAKLWRQINDHEQVLENYEKAARPLGSKLQNRIPRDDLERVLEKERLRRREALQYLFLRSLNLKERKRAADLMRTYLELSAKHERKEAVEYLEGLLRTQDYIEDPTLTYPEDVTTSILANRSLGFLNDLRFELLQELLSVAPNDPYLLESVASINVRKADYQSAKEITARFVRLPVVDRLKLYESFAEYRATEG